MTTTKPDTMPRLYGLRVALWELLAVPERAATLRWRHRNAEQPRTCMCGEPGTVRVEAPGALGSVNPCWWMCAAHAAVPLTVPWANGQPLTGQPRHSCTWAGSDNASDRITECGCGTHVGQTTEEWCRRRTDTSPHRPDPDTTTDRGATQ